MNKLILEKLEELTELIKKNEENEDSESILSAESAESIETVSNKSVNKSICPVNKSYKKELKESCKDCPYIQKNGCPFKDGGCPFRPKTVVKVTMMDTFLEYILPIILMCYIALWLGKKLDCM